MLEQRGRLPGGDLRNLGSGQDGDHGQRNAAQVGTIDHDHVVADRPLREVGGHRRLALVVELLQIDLAAANAALGVGLVHRQLDAVPGPVAEVGVQAAHAPDQIDLDRRTRAVGVVAAGELTAAGERDQAGRHQ